MPGVGEASHFLDMTSKASFSELVWTLTHGKVGPA